MTEQQALERARLEARLDDYLERSERGSSAVSCFLTPREQKQAEQYLSRRGVLRRCVFWGGYAGAERACLLVLPFFYEEISDRIDVNSENADGESTDGGGIDALFADLEDDRIVAVRISGSGYRNLTHRDYLGSLLGLGLERDALGDIAVQSPREAVVFCKRRMVGFLTEALEKVASDTVRCKEWTLDESFTDGKSYQPISDTVASARLDCVVAALTNLSRDDAQKAVRSGLVELDFEPEERVDRILVAPMTISIRGFGRFILRSFDGETKKGRLRLRADRLIS